MCVLINWSRACPRSVYLRIQEIQSILNVLYHNQSNGSKCVIDLRRLIFVTYASSRWRGKKFLIEHVVKVKTLNGNEHDGWSFKRWYGFYAFTGGREHFIFFLLKLNILEAKVKFWCGTHMTQLFLNKFLIFTKF